MRFWLSGFMAFALLFAGVSAAAAEGPAEKSGRITAQLVTNHDMVEPGQDLYIALSMRLEPKWHTYWRNPGGPGTPAMIDWDIPKGTRIGNMVWPLPMIVHTGPIVNYAFEDRLLLPMPLSIPADVQPGDALTLKAKAHYLVCFEVCRPEGAELQITIPVGEPKLDARWDANIRRTIENAPKPANVEVTAQMIGGKLHVSALGQYDNPYFFPYEQDLINADNPQALTKGDKGITLSMTPGFLLKDGLTRPVSGVLAFDLNGKRTGIEITATPNAGLDIGAASSSMKTILWLWAVFFGALFMGLAFYFLRRKPTK